MSGVWVTNFSTTVEAMMALDGDFVPGRIYLRENPAVVEEFD